MLVDTDLDQLVDATLDVRLGREELDAGQCVLVVRHALVFAILRFVLPVLLLLLLLTP